MMRLTGDYHSHSTFSDGKNTVLENAIRAKEIGLKQLAISDHGLSHVMLGLTYKKLPALREEVEQAKKITGIDILMGIESNLRSLDGEPDLLPKDYDKFDYFLCGIHEALFFKTHRDCRKILYRNFFSYRLGFQPSKSLIDDTTKALILLVKNHPVDVLAHIHYKSFCDVVEVAKACADYGTYIELNTKKQHINVEQLNKIAETGVHFVINSDAHSADRIGDYAIAEDLLKHASVKEEQIDNINGKIPNFRFKEFKKHHS